MGQGQHELYSNLGGGLAVMENRVVRQGPATILTGPWLWLLVCLVGIVLITSLGPAEKSLGVNVRIVYLHGAWVWAALAGFVAAGLAGAAGLVTRKFNLYTWSASLGLTGLIFWITYLPISLWAMQANWNGLFLAEPRWRLAAVFAVTGFMLQLGLFLVHRPVIIAWGNVIFVGVLLVMLRTTQDVMHPASPIFSSDSTMIQVYFIVLLLFIMIFAWQIARILKDRISLSKA